MMKSSVAYAAGSFLLLAMATMGACATSTHTSNHGQGGDGGTSSGGGDDSGQFGPGGGDDSGNTFGTSSGGMGTCTTLQHMCASNCSDFETGPVMDKSAPANAASLFSGSGGSGGPCISDPQDGTLIPQNWLRPRIAYTGGSGQVFQITLTDSAREANPLVGYTTQNSWTVPKKDWDTLRANAWGDKISVQVCAVASGGGTPSCSTSSFTIAPASAGGSMIYWAAVGPNQAPAPSGVAQSWLEGFAPGDESVATTLTTTTVQALQLRDQGTGNGPGTGSRCIGCHTAVPDGASVSFIDFYPWPGSAANVSPAAFGDAGITGQVPPWLTTQGALQLSMPWLGGLTFSSTDWQTEKVAITTYGCPTVGPLTMNLPWNGQSCSNPTNTAPGSGILTPSLIWTQLDAMTPSTAYDAGQYMMPQPNVEAVMSGFGTSWGYLARTGDNNGAAFPSWSHDGTKIVYVSTDGGKDGRIGCKGGGPNGSANTQCNSTYPATTIADLYTIPFNNKQGGAASPVPGASSASAAEYYPAFSEDDKFIAFDLATQQGINGIYYNSYGEVNIIPASGGTPTRLAANDPVACPVTIPGQNGQPPTTMVPKSPGVYNSWPKWSPEVESCPDGFTYYWLVFSSARQEIPFNASNFGGGASPDGPTSQLYITGIKVDSKGAITTFPALFIWNQPTTSLSTSPVAGQPQSNHTPVWETITIPRMPNAQAN
jgi:hypothetical protein